MYDRAMEFSNYLRCFWPLGDATDATDVPAAQKVVGRLSRSLEKERDYDARGAAAGPIALARSLALQRCTGCERATERRARRLKTTPVSRLVRSTDKEPFTYDVRTEGGGG